MEVIYLKHPVSPEQKAKANKEGKRIIDAKYAPVQEKPKAKPKTKRKSKGVKHEQHNSTD